jgi:hypothetical protein
MADFAPNATARYVLKYHVAGRDHNMLVRLARGTPAASIGLNGSNYLLSVFQAMAAILASDLAFVSAAYALTDSDLFFPAQVPPAVVGGSALAGFSKQDTITHATFSGRGSLGSKCNVKLYGVNWAHDIIPAQVESDFVVLASELTQIANAVNALNGGAAVIVAIDNSQPNYAARATIKVNDYWLRRVRQGL